MRLCFDATRFGCGLDGAVELAAKFQLPAVEYSFSPFDISSKKKVSLSAAECDHLENVHKQAQEKGITITCLNLDYCLEPEDKQSIKQFTPMLLKVAAVAKSVACAKISFTVVPSEHENWKNIVVNEVNKISAKLSADSSTVGLLMRMSTPATFRNRSLKKWRATEPQDWRDIIANTSGLGLSFSPADCVWLGLDYLRLLSGLASAIDHVEAHDIEINRDLLADSGMYGPLWWRYRLISKGQVDWRQFIEALKLYDFKGTLSIHLDDEFIANETEELEKALTTSLKFISPLIRG